MMQGKILIVDAIATNRIVLKVKLAAAHYKVLQANTAAEAITLARAEAPDLIICALTMPDSDAAGFCARLRACSLCKHVPVMAIGCRPDPQTRIAALRAGIQDILLKPLDDTLLLGRVRSLIRAHNTSAEWRMRDDTSQALGLAEPTVEFTPASHCMLVSNQNGRAQRWMMQLRPMLRSKLSLANAADVFRVSPDAVVPDVFVLILPVQQYEALAIIRLISAIRANAATRHAGILVLQTAPNVTLAADALDLGADDLMTDGFDAEELTLRLRSLLRRKRLDAQQRETFQTGIKAAVQDPLTGLHNRRYAMPYLDRIASHAQRAGRPFAVMVGDLDHFKQINDAYGHASGDAVLVEVAIRLRMALRPGDLVARIGGEEFLIVLPSTSPQDARDAATRICNDIGAIPFDVPGSSAPIQVTISIGMVNGNGGPRGTDMSDNTGAALLQRADKALYSAKLRGRNRVTLSRPAA